MRPNSKGKRRGNMWIMELTLNGRIPVGLNEQEGADKGFFLDLFNGGIGFLVSDNLAANKDRNLLMKLKMIW